MEKIINQDLTMNEILVDYNFNDRRRKTALVLDVETALTPKYEQLIFDIGWTVSSVSNEKMVKHRSYLVREVFLNMDLMQRAYYFKKYPSYVEGLAVGNIILAPFNEIIKVLNDDIKELNVNTLYAYNAKFDSSAIARTNAYLNPLTPPMNYDIKCLWSLASQTIMATQKFVLTAIENNWLTENNNIKTSAEITYRFLSKDYDFIEAHTGLEDSIIETKILWAINKNTKVKDKECKKQPWRRVKKLRQEMGLEIEEEES